MSFGKALRRLRTSENLTQLQLANALGIAKSTVSMYENGEREPSFETLEAIADFFNVEMADLVIGKIPHEEKISEGEAALLDLFRSVPEDRQQIVLSMIKAALQN